MNVEAEVDQELRIVLPRGVADALQLTAGERLPLEMGTSYILLQTRPAGLYRENGLLVFDHGRPLPPDHVHWLDQDREERIDQIMGPWKTD